MHNISSLWRYILVFWHFLLYFFSVDQWPGFNSIYIVIYLYVILDVFMKYNLKGKNIVYKMG